MTHAPPMVVAFAAPPDPGVAEALRARGGIDVVLHPGAHGQDLAPVAAAADVLVVRSWQRVAAPVLEAGRGRLRAVVQASAGLDNIDERGAAAAGIEVVGVDPGNATAVAELTLMSIVALLRNVRGHWEHTVRGSWPDRERLQDGEARGRTLALVGIGRVGTRVARRAGAFEMRVLAYDPYVGAHEVAARGAERVDALPALLRAADVLSLHCPLTAETRGMISAPELALLPRGALVINTARGDVLDNAALVAALDAGHLAGAALDVYPDEPPPPGGVLDHARILCTPHLGGHTAESHRERARNMAAALLALCDRLERSAAGECP